MRLKLLLCFLLLCTSIILINISAEEKTKYILIDPGHGGMDPGSNIGNIKESDIVLEISFKIAEVLESFGYNVVLTRENKESLCEGEFIKKEDTEKRINTINSHNTIIVISIHLNEFGLSEYRGGQVFYNDNNPANKLLANHIQKSLKMYLKNTDRSIIKKENNYLLKRITCPACIVECGFMSNDQELSLLLDEKYQYRLAMSILYGINSYLSEKNINNNY